MFLKASPVKIKGAGIKGLSLAHFLKKRGIDACLYEASARAGGWIRTFHKEGFLFEGGPRGVKANSLIFNLIDEIGLTSEVTYANPLAKRRYLYVQGKLREAKSFLPRLIPGLVKDLFIPREKEELSIKDYFEKRLGTFVTENLIEALCTGIYAGDIARLSARRCFPAIAKGHSLLRMFLFPPKAPLISFKGGMECLTQALSDRYPVSYNRKDELCDIDCTPLAEAEKVSLAVVSFGWRDLSLDYKGFGYLVPPAERSPILGAVFDSMTFPAQNSSPHEMRISVMMGGFRRPDIMKKEESALVELGFETLARHLNIKAFPDVFKVSFARDAILQPHIGSDLNGEGVAHAVESSCKISQSEGILKLLDRHR